VYGLPFRCVIHTFAALELSFGGANILGEFRPLDELFVFRYVQKDGRSPTVLGQYKRTAGLLGSQRTDGGDRRGRSSVRASTAVLFLLREHDRPATPFQYHLSSRGIELEDHAPTQ
jgi:hypothetical protein